MHSIPLLAQWFTRGLVVACSAVASSTALVAAEFECRWAASPPVIDGRTDDAAWKHAQVVESFTKGWEIDDARKPKTHTKARLLWDREYLYFSAEMEDTDVFANVSEQDGQIWLCDVFELFFKPAKDKPGYYEFEVNAANAKLDMFLPSRGSGGFSRHGKERDFHIESAVQVHGTLNNWSDTDKGWTVEGRIPWRDFLPTGGRPVPGEVWQHALCRYDYSAGFEAPDLSSNAPLSKANYHLYEDYVPLKFVGPGEGADAKRVPWDVSRLVGSPEPPLPFRAVPAFPKLKTKEPIMIVNEPGRADFLLIECNGYVPVRKARICRLANDPAVAESEVLLEIDESAYDLCFHPRFAENGHLYLGANGRFGEGKDDYNTRVLRYTMDRKTGQIDPASRQVIIEWQSHGHNGAALTFGKDGMLYVTSGDGTSDSDDGNSGQDLTRLLAKVLRIDVDHPADGRLYGIPADNPFLKTAGARPETWAYGFRNPWRMTMDRETGDIWVGENGQDLWEYARIVHRGENYGWPLVEGSHPFQPQRKQGPTPISKPLIEHPHTDFRSLTGGIVYRGSKFPELAGSYVYGDHSTGQIWAARQEKGKLIKDERIAQAPLGITAFCETPQGDILVVDYLGSVIRKLERAPQTTPAPPFPAKLSETGLFTDTAALKPHPALIRYDVNAAAWHDGAKSERHIALPGTERMEVKEQGGWVFPDGTAVAQTLSLEGRRIETRVLLRQLGEWEGYTYVWNDAQTDAVRAPAAGETLVLASQQSWRVPGRQECMFCHSRAAGFVLGLSAAQLNRPGNDGENQLVRWERMGLLKFNHAAKEEGEWRWELGKQKLSDVELQEKMAAILRTDMQREPALAGPLLPSAPAALARIVDPRDEGAPLHDRARAYLHANCSHCHTRAGGGNSTMQLAGNIADKDMEIVNALPIHATYGVPDARLAVPGDPGRSMLVFRPAVRGPGQMPPVGTTAADAEGVALLAKWIAGMSAEAPKETAKKNAQ
jgi:glucose/arabinose dehydrogenase/mono/diheme cytochrome c family protein